MSRSHYWLSRRPIIAVVIGLTASLLATAAGRISFVDRVEAASYDWRVRHEAAPAGAASPVVIVDIDDGSVERLAPLVGRWPWPRAVHAGLIDYLARSGARVIAYDVLFGEHEGRSQTTINGVPVTGDQSDLALTQSVRAAGNVVLLADATSEGLASGAGVVPPGASLALPGPVYHPGDGFQRRPALQLPFDDLAAATAAVGHNVLIRDPGSDFARRMLPFIQVGATAVPSLGMAAALRFEGIGPDRVVLEGDALRIGTTRMPLVADPAPGAAGVAIPSRQVLLRFRRPRRQADGVTSVFPTYTFFDVLLSGDQAASGKTPAIPPSAFAGKLVFVGTTAAGTYDRYSTPFAAGAAGVELHATLADDVLSAGFMRRAPWPIDAAVTAAAGLAAAAAAVLLPVFWASGVVALLVVGLGAGLTRAVGSGFWLAMVTPGLAAAAALFGGVAWQYVVEGREKRQIRRLFSRYVSKAVVEQLLVNPALAGLGGERREMTVLFSDIRGFTTASERGTPEAVVAQLNEYFGAMVEVLFRHQGTLDKFVGDMVMGLFGAPLADPAHADHAVAAALDMAAALERLNARWAADGRPTLDIGIGINSGEMIAGNIGAESIMSYTVIGDAVNLGSRLESLNKEYGTRILISDATRARLTIPIATREIGMVTVKGRQQPVLVHEVAGRVTGPASSSPVGDMEQPR